MVPASVRRKRRWTFLAALLVMSGDLHGQEASWVGKKVLTKYHQPLQDGDRVVDDGSSYLVYTVAREDGPRLLLEAGGVRGWVDSAYVMPLDEAVDFYSQGIRANPWSAVAYVWRGLVWQETGELDKALADFDEAIRLEPKYSAAF